MQLERNEGNLHYYVEPYAVHELPRDMTSGAYVAQLEAKLGVSTESVSDASTGLASIMTTAREFLDGPSTTLGVFGEPGSGKTMLVWLFSRALVRKLDKHLATPVKRTLDGAGHHAALPWLPIVLDLKKHSACGLATDSPRGLQGALEAHLVMDCRMSAEAVAYLKSGPGADASVRPRVRLLVLCDGLDELQGPSAAVLKIGSLLSAICGDEAWTGCDVKMVVTCRESHVTAVVEREILLVHDRRVILPFSTPQVERRVAIDVVGGMLVVRHAFV